MGLQIFKRIENVSGGAGFLGEILLTPDELVNVAVHFREPVVEDFIWLLFGGSLRESLSMTVAARARFLSPTGAVQIKSSGVLINETIDNVFLTQEAMSFRLIDLRSFTAESLYFEFGSAGLIETDWVRIKFFAKRNGF